MQILLKRTLLLAALLLPLAGWAQEITLTDVSPRGYDGVKSLDGKSYYTFYFGEKTETKGMANFILELFDQDLKKINSTNIELKKGSELAGSCFNGTNFLFVFVDWARKTLSMVTLDAKGTIVAQKEQEDVKRNLLDVDNYSNILSVENDFVMVKPIKEKKYGFTVERLDNKLNVKWTKEYLREDKAIIPLMSRSGNGKVYILKQDKPNYNADKFEDFVVCLDPANGNEIYNYSLFDGESSGWPSSIVVDEKGNVATSGMYFNGQKFDDVNSDGLFFLAIDATGKKLAYNKAPWKEIIDKIKDENSGLLIGGKTKTMVQDIIRKADGSYMVIAETFRKSNNADNTGDLVTKTALKMGGMGASKSPSGTEEKKIGFTVMDFIFFSYDNTGNLTDIKKVRKEPRSVVITGKLTSETGLGVAMVMQEAGYFTYQYMLEHNDKQYLVYRDYDGLKQKAYFLDINADDTKEVPAIDMNKNISEGLNKTSKTLGMLAGEGTGSQLEYNSSADPWHRGSSMKWRGIVKGKPGHMLMFEYTNMKLEMWLVKLPM